jgi:hypothetical protein
MNKLLELDQIRIDGGTQSREEINQATVDEYAESMRQLVSFPALVVYHDGVNTWLADGFHRYHAAKKIGASALDVEWRVGTLEQARLFAASANAKHGLRRTAGDKRRAIELLLSTEEGRRMTQREIAKHCHVAQSYVCTVMASGPDFPDYHTDSPLKKPRRAEPTRAEQKRARIAAAVRARPTASNSAIARELGVDRETVAAVRAAAKVAGPPVGPDRHAPSAAPEPSRSGYSTRAADEVARAALAMLRETRAVLTNSDWEALLAEIGAIA